MTSGPAFQSSTPGISRGRAHGGGLAAARSSMPLDLLHTIMSFRVDEGEWEDFEFMLKGYAFGALQ